MSNPASLSATDRTTTALAELSRLPQDAFVARLEGIFEHSPWIAERAWSAGPFTSIDALHAAMYPELYATYEAFNQVLAGMPFRDAYRDTASKVEGKTIYNVANGYIIACFDNEIDDNIVTDIAKMEPQYAVLRDRSIKDDSTATNFEQIFKTYSPTTLTKIL